MGWALAFDVDRALQWEGLEHLTGAQPVNGQPIRSRNIHHPDHALARTYLWARLRGVPALRTREEPFSAEGRDDLANLIGVLPGADPTLDPIVVGAHFDSTASLAPSWVADASLAPGADDDASGCVAVLEIARLLANRPGGFQRDIEFVLFDAEEEGLIGSERHVAARTRPVHVMFSLDPIGYNAGGAGWLFASVGEETEPMQEQLQTAFDGLQRTTLEQFDIVSQSLIGPPRSDHGPFIDAGFPAIHIGTFPQPPTYHTPDDTLEVVDPGFLAETTELMATVVARLAGPVPVEESGCRTAPHAPVRWGRRR